MQKKSCTQIFWCLLYGSLAMILGIAPPALAAGQANQMNTHQEATMLLAYQETNESANIPAIDRVTPAVFETAAFGLG